MRLGDRSNPIKVYNMQFNIEENEQIRVKRNKTVTYSIDALLVIGINVLLVHLLY